VLKRGECFSARPAASLAPLCLRLGKIKPKNIFPQRSGKGSPAGYVWALWGSDTSLKERENHPHFSAGLLRRAWCRNAPLTKQRAFGVPLLPSPPVIGGALSSLVRSPSAWVRFAFCHFALFTSLRPQGFTAQIAASVSY